MSYRCASIFLALGMTISSSGATLSAQSQAQRRIIQTPPEVIASIGDRGGVELYRPGNLVSTPSGNIAVFDYDGMNVRMFSTDGSELWSFGAEGGGPGEFRGNEGLLVERSGAVLVVDNDNKRITRLSADGKLIGMTPIPDRMVVRRLLPSQHRNEIRVIPLGTSFLWVTLDTTGTVLSQAPLPDDIDYSTNIVGESYTAPFDDGAVIAYRWAGKMIVLRQDGSVRSVFNGIHRVPFPESVTRQVDIPGMNRAAVTRVDPRASEVAISVAASNDRVFVLSPNTDDERYRFIDVYELATGEYLGSYRMPGTVQRIAALDSHRIATLETDLVPVVRIWRLNNDRR